MPVVTTLFSNARRNVTLPRRSRLAVKPERGLGLPVLTPHPAMAQGERCPPFARGAHRREMLP